MKKKIALVLEGGGMRGAYTAGCLAWLIDHNLHFPITYGISTGAVHACSYLLQEKDYLYELSTNYITDKKLIGWRPLLREGKFVGYDYLFHVLLPQIFHFDIKRLLKVSRTQHAKIGLYDLQKQETVYVEAKDLDDGFLLLKAAASLPIIGKAVSYQGKLYLDGGITDMIPLKQAIKDGNDTFLVITTKPKDYVRKRANPWVVKLMGLVYAKYPKMKEQYAQRHLNYQKQTAAIQTQVDAGHALHLYPSESIPVSRLKGDKRRLRQLYDLGYQDMETHKEAIFQLLKEE